MGGLTMLKYITKYGYAKLNGIINIEGNLAEEDCLFSAKVIKYHYQDFCDIGFQEIVMNMRKNISCGYQTIANNMELNTNLSSYFNYSFQTVKYSATGELLDTFLNLNIPKIFLHGDKNNQLSYIPKLKSEGITVKEIPNSDHFLFYDNPSILYKNISEFIQQNI